MTNQPTPFCIPEGTYYTLTQVAELLGVYPQTVLWWVNHGRLPAQRLPGLGYIVAEQDALNAKVRRRRRNRPAAGEG